MIEVLSKALPDSANPAVITMVYVSARIVVPELTYVAIVVCRALTAVSTDF
jgi:hypothetical protein